MNLNFLDLSSNQISDVSEITNLSSITTVNLHNQVFEEVTTVSNESVKEGTITYDGIDIKNIEKESLRKSIGIVLQDINLFTGTIKENIILERALIDLKGKEYPDVEKI